MNQWIIAIILQALGLLLREDPVSAMTMDQFVTSLDTLRAGCAPKFKIEASTLDRLRMGDFSQEASQDVMCYAKCITLMVGTVNKKGDFNAAKALAQLPHLVPAELLDVSTRAINACKDVYKNYKDSCEKVYQTAKCVGANGEGKLMFP
ncbi:general odorant-binding protein lush [Drosophila bipectinata]|uniref:general odorant-binding protein lush n=1 Tax=Drosophila bipectinata TaxID=42026 RepID=UPI001C8A0EDA|nr:general odorant-binding protein lush [Drosophila bipectinata]